MPIPPFILQRRQRERPIITNIFIGIDFGTSFTKVSYSYAPTRTPQIESIKWETDFFKPTVLYIQNGSLFFDKPTGESKEIKYFKYSIIDTKLKNHTVNTLNHFEELCCVYFLSQIIKRSLKTIQAKLQIQNMNEIKKSINMGVPLENFYEEENMNNKGLYERILHNAILIADDCLNEIILPINQVSISTLDSIYTEILKNEYILNWTANVYPELAAELLLYHQSKFVKNGVYSTIDVGGGTVDMAIFQKDTNSRLYCLAQKILPYGIEILKEAPDSVSATKFQNEFESMLKKSKNHCRDFKKLPVFFLGGGANNPWYSNIIKNKVDLNVKFQPDIPALSFNINIEDFIKDEEMLIQKNQRLIISQMLARPKDDIGDVQGFPNWFTQFDEQNLTKSKENTIENQNEIMAKRADDSGLNITG